MHPGCGSRLQDLEEKAPDLAGDFTEATKDRNAQLQEGMVRCSLRPQPAAKVRWKAGEEMLVSERVSLLCAAFATVCYFVPPP